MDIMKEIASWLGFLGVPSIFAMTIYCIKECRAFTEQFKILQNAQKAQMRSQLMDQYYKYSTRGEIYDDELDDWINQYNAYHKLVGNNGVLDKKRELLLDLPTLRR